ncbi:hypothetical protein FPANT_11540 [Fusarium pseudoanthophilum]|uniref:Ribonuclease H1 N-terminal domain-containing protein n=1 Tax=Fusarium pseudoanthophilum TaxID=48495 RepID=A0A8H5KN36_9HYPO|nr:hypothetical protein FPANT_11540 [Fusarium pseudoanthophilum]
MARRKESPFYAVRIYNWTTIVTSWKEASALCNGVKGSNNKGCNTREEAQWLLSKECTDPWARCWTYAPPPSDSSAECPPSGSPPTESSTAESSSVESTALETSSAVPSSSAISAQSSPDPPRPAKRSRTCMEDSDKTSPAPVDNGTVFTDSNMAMMHLLETLRNYTAVRITPIGPQNEL